LHRQIHADRRRPKAALVGHAASAAVEWPGEPREGSDRRTACETRTFDGDMHACSHRFAAASTSTRADSRSTSGALSSLLLTADAPCRDLGHDPATADAATLSARSRVSSGSLHFHRDRAVRGLSRRLLTGPLAERADEADWVVAGRVNALSERGGRGRLRVSDFEDRPACDLGSRVTVSVFRRYRAGDDRTTLCDGRAFKVHIGSVVTDQSPTGDPSLRLRGASLGVKAAP